MCINKEELLLNIQSIAKECGGIILNANREALGVTVKSGKRDLVTKYDVAVQKFAVSRLREYYPEASFFCEEGDRPDCLRDPLVFIIDPIDGTANFAADLHHSCVSVGCFRNGKPFAGAVYNPYTDELFSAAVGTGAYLNGETIKATELPLKETIAIFGTSPYNPELLDDTFERAKKIFAKTLDIRRSGSAALDICYVAAGRAGFFFENILALWDYAAAITILNEAGGKACTFDGKPLPLTGVKTNIIAGTKATVSESGFLN